MEFGTFVFVSAIDRRRTLFFLFLFFFSSLFSSVHLLFVYPVFGVLLLLLFHILDRAPCILHHYTNQLITPTQKKKQLVYKVLSTTSSQD